MNSRFPLATLLATKALRRSEMHERLNRRRSTSTNLLANTMTNATRRDNCLQWLINLTWIAAVVGAFAYGSFKSYELSQTHHAYRVSLQAIVESHTLDEDGEMADRIREFLDERPEKLGNVLAFAAELRVESEKAGAPVKRRPTDE